MNPIKSHLVLVAPPTLEKRLDVLRAIETLAAPVEDEQQQRRCAEKAATSDALEKLRRDCKGLEQAWYETCWEVAKIFTQSRVRRRANAQRDRAATDALLKRGYDSYDPNEPRIPKHHAGGGEWTRNTVAAADNVGVRSGEPPPIPPPGPPNLPPPADPGRSAAAGAAIGGTVGAIIGGATGGLVGAGGGSVVAPGVGTIGGGIGGALAGATEGAAWGAVGGAAIGYGWDQLNVFMQGSQSQPASPGSSTAGPDDANKANHIFGDPRHNMDPVLNQFGSRESAFAAIKQSTEQVVQALGLQGVFETQVPVGSSIVTVRGNIVGGTVRIGTAFIP